MPRVDVPDVGAIDFPDDAPDQEIQDTLNEMFPAKQPETQPIDPATLRNFDQQLEQQRLGRELHGGSLFAPGGQDMEFARALYRDVPAKIGEGIHTLMKPIEFVARPIFQNLREATGPTQYGMTGEVLPELKPGESVLHGLEPPPEAAGVIPSVRRAAAGMTTPGSFFVAPLAAGGGTIPRLVTGAFAAGAGAAIPGAIQSFVEADTPAEKRGAITDIGLNTLFAGAMGKQAARPSAKTTTKRTQDALQQKAEGAVRDVRQPEVTPESAAALPVSEGSAKAAEALTQLESQPVQQWLDQVKQSGFKDQTDWSYRFAEQNPNLTSAELLAAKSRAMEASKAAGFPDGGMKMQFFSEASKWRQALDEAAAIKNPTKEQLGEIEQRVGVGGPDRGAELQAAIEKKKGGPLEKAKTEEVLTPTLVASRQVGEKIRVEFDASKGPITAEQVKQAFAGPDRSVEVVAIAPDVASTTQGRASFDVIVGTPEGPYSSALAAKAYKEVLGTDKPLTGKSALEQAAPLRERLQRVVSKSIEAKPERSELPQGVPEEVQEALNNWRRAEKRKRRALRQEPSDVADAIDARDVAEGEFQDIAAKHKISEEMFRELRLIAKETDTDTMPEPSGALAHFPRQSEALGLGEPSLPPTIETVRAHRAAEASEAQPQPTMFPVEGESVKMRKSAERATESPMIPEPVQERIAEAPESFYQQQSMARVEDTVGAMTDTQLGSVPRDSNLYTAAKLEQAKRLFERGENDAGYNVFAELEKEGTRLGQLINQFKLLKGSRPEQIVRVINSDLVKAGKDPLTKPQEAKAIEVASKSKKADADLDAATKEWMEKPTDANAAKAESALADAHNSGLELQRFVSRFRPRSTASVLKSVLQGNLLTPISEVANIVGNISFLPFRQATRGVATVLDVLDNYLTGRPREITVQPIKGTVEAAKGVGRGLKQVPSLVMRGTGDVIKGETRAGLHPIQAWINQFSKNPEMPTTGGKLTLKDRLNLAIEGTMGVPAETMLRGLGAGDVAFREAARARAIATELELAGVPRNKWDFAQKFPEMHLNEAALNRIHSETMQAIFQRQSNTLNLITNWIRGKGELFDLAVATVAPYKLTPWNIIGEVLSYNPLVAAAKTFKEAKAGNRLAAKQNAAKYVVGSMLVGAGWWLYKNGLMSPSMDQRDEAQKARILAGEVLPPNHINLSGLKRKLTGGDPSFQKGDETADVFRAGGLAGSMFYMTANIGRSFERKPEVADSEVWGAILRQSTLEQARFGLNQSFLSGIEGLLAAIREGNADNYVRQWANTVTSIPLPNSLSTLSRATREYKPEFREDEFKKQVENIVKNKLGFAGMDDYLPLKRGLWGEPLRETPEGRNALVYHFFDVFKNKQVTSDPVPLELFRLWRKTGDTRVIPSLPEKEITIANTTYPLTAAQQSRYAELVGTSRRKIVDAVVVNPEFHKLSDENKADILDKIYRAGLQQGKVQFWSESGGTLKPKPGKAGF